MVLAASHTAGGVALVFFAAYLTPTIVALVRKVRNRGSVIVVNVLLGWTIIGWIVALAMAARSDTLERSV